MNIWMILLGLYIVWTAIWVVAVRPWLRVQPWAVDFFEWVEPIETALWRKSESILWARTLQVTGALLTVLTLIGQINLLPLLVLLPDEYQSIGAKIIPLLPTIISVVGTIDEFLRRDVSEPLEVVSVQIDAPVAVHEAVANFEAAKVEVKAVIAESAARAA